MESLGNGKGDGQGGREIFTRLWQSLWLVSPWPWRAKLGFEAEASVDSAPCKENKHHLVRAARTPTDTALQGLHQSGTEEKRRVEEITRPGNAEEENGRKREVEVQERKMRNKMGKKSFWEFWVNHGKPGSPLQFHLR